MSLTYHSRNGRSTPWMIVSIALTTILLVIVLLFVMGSRSQTEGELPVQDNGIENSIQQEPEIESENEVFDPSQTQDLSEVKGVTEEPDVLTEGVSFDGSVIAGATAPLLDFNQPDFDKAMASDKLVVLYFYANWGPVCKTEVSTALYPAFNEWTEPNIVGFRVNYNDNQTDLIENDLAELYGVTYQHTKVFLRDGERVLKNTEAWTKERFVEEFTNYTPSSEPEL